MLGWKTYTYYYGTDELPNSSGIWAIFYHSKYIFSRIGIGFIKETDYKKPNQTEFSANTLVNQSCK